MTGSIKLCRNLLPAAIIAMTPATHAAVFTYDFDTSQEDFNSLFASAGSGEFSTAGVPGWNETGGVGAGGGVGANGGSGWIRTGGNGNSALLLQESDFSTVGSSNTVSVFLEARLNNNSEGISGFANFGVGFAPSTTTNFTTDQYAVVHLQNFVAPQSGDPDNQRLGLRSRESGSFGGTQLVSTSNNIDVDIVTGDWYKLELELTKLATVGEFEATATVWDYGPEGISAPQLLDSFTATLTNLPTLWNAPQLHAGFHGYSQGGTGGTFGFDNFSATVPDPPVIPEPASMSLVALGGTLLLARRRRG